MNPERTLYPCYFDCALTRKAGRRVPLDMARETPKTKTIHRAAKKSGLSARIEDGAHHPAFWWKQEGRVIVEWPGTKEDLLKKVAQKL